MPPSRPDARTGLLTHRLFGWRTRLALLASFVLATLAPLRVARTEGESEWKEQRAPGEEEVEATHAAAARSTRRASRVPPPNSALRLARAPKIISPTAARVVVCGQVTLPRRTGPPPDDNDLG